MANILKRMKQSVETDLHDLLDKKEKRNPMSRLNQFLRESERETIKVKELIKRQYLLKEELEREYRIAKELAEKRRYQAEISSSAEGQEDLYEFAIRDMTIFEERAAKIEHLKVQLMLDLKQLEYKYTLMEQKLKDMHIKRLEWMGRENIVNVHNRMDKLMEEGQQTHEMEGYTGIDDYMKQIENRIQTAYNEATIDARIEEIEKNMNK